jgi:hypothetical protein
MDDDRPTYNINSEGQQGGFTGHLELHQAPTPRVTAGECVQSNVAAGDRYLTQFVVQLEAAYAAHGIVATARGDAIEGVSLRRVGGGVMHNVLDDAYDEVTELHYAKIGAPLAQLYEVNVYTARPAKVDVNVRLET